MTSDDPFDSSLAAAIRADAPDGAPPALRRRVEASLRAEQRRPARRVPLLAIAAGAVVLLLAIAAGGPRLADIGPGATQWGSGPIGTESQTATATSPVAPTAPPLDEPVADPGKVQTGQLLTANDGWVMNTDNRVFLTHSGGAAWRDVTPPGLASTAILIPSFIDPMHGWVAVNDEDTKAVRDVWRTTDSGVTWTRATLRDVHTAGSALLFQSPTVGWLATDPGGQQPKPELRWTDDGGVTWSDPIDLAIATGIPTLPELAFADRQHGALTADDVVRVTADGGRTWTDSDMPDLPPIATANGNFRRFSLPVFVDQVHGFLSILVTNPDLAPLTKLVLATDNAGASWHLALRDDRIRNWAFVGESTWIGVRDGEVSTSRDGGVTFDVRSSVGLPTALGRAWMTFVDPDHGWGTATRACPPNRYGCFAGPELFATSDGGASWTRIGDCIFTCEAPKPS